MSTEQQVLADLREDLDALDPLDFTLPFIDEATATALLRKFGEEEVRKWDTFLENLGQDAAGIRAALDAALLDAGLEDDD